jgi:hypothetical protein
MAAGQLLSEKDNGTAAANREIPTRKSCTGYRVYKTLAVVYGVIFFVSESDFFLLTVCHLVISRNNNSLKCAIVKLSFTFMSC